MFLKLIKPGEQALANEGFLQIKYVLYKRKATLVILLITFNPLFSNQVVKESYHTATVRIHVEKAIQRVEISRILSHIPVHLFAHIHAILHVCSIVANTQHPLIDERNDNF